MKLLCLFSFFITSLVYAKPLNTGWFNSNTIKGYDSVAYFTEGKALKGNKKFTFKWNGAVWNFSSQKNLNLFKANPELYAPQYGGYCAYAMAEGKKVSIDPKSFDVLDGKLYLNYNKKIQRKWADKASSYIKSADSEWKQID